MIDNNIDVSVRAFKQFTLQRNLRIIWTLICIGLFYVWLNVVVINKDMYFKPCYFIKGTDDSIVTFSADEASVFDPSKVVNMTQKFEAISLNFFIQSSLALVCSLY